MGINSKRMDNVQTMVSPSIEARMDSSNVARPSLEFKPTASEIKNTANQETAAQLHHVINKEGEKKVVPIKTIAEADRESTLSTGAMLYGGRKALSLVASGFAAAAMVAVTVLPKDSALRKFIETWASRLTRLSIGIVSGVTGAIDAKDQPLLAAAQIGDVVTSMVSPIKNMTTNRGLCIGAYNVLPALATVHGKAKFTGLQDYLSTNWNALKSIFNSFLKNPLGLFDSAQKGGIAVLSGIAMSLTSLLYMLTGFEPFATARNVLGVTVEMEKPKHLAQGRDQYAFSGYSMMAGSVANIMGQYSKSNPMFWSYLNLLLNTVGKERFQAALQSGEPTRTAAPMSVGEMLSKNIGNMFNFGRETEKVLKNAQPVVVSQAQQSLKVQNEIQKVQAANGNGVVSNPGSSVGRATSRTSVARNINAAPAPVVANTAAAKSPEVKTAATSVSTERQAEVQPAVRTPVAPTVVASSKTTGESVRIGETVSRNAKPAKNITAPKIQVKAIAKAG